MTSSLSVDPVRRLLEGKFYEITKKCENSCLAHRRMFDEETQNLFRVEEQTNKQTNSNKTKMWRMFFTSVCQLQLVTWNLFLTKSPQNK